MLLEVPFEWLDEVEAQERANGTARLSLERTEVKLPEALAWICFEGLLHFGRLRDVRGDLFLPEVTSLGKGPDFGLAYVSLTPREDGEPADQKRVAPHGGSPLWGEVCAQCCLSTDLICNPGQVVVGYAPELLSLLDLGIVFKRKLGHQLPYPGEIERG